MQVHNQYGCLFNKSSTDMSDYKMIMNIKTPLIILGTTSARDQ